MLEEKINKSKKIIAEAFLRYGTESLRVAWTGGKDSTLTTWLIRWVCKEKSKQIPRCFFINEGDIFEEIEKFVKDISKKWNLNVDYLHNKDVSLHSGGKLGRIVKVSDLNERNQAELRRIGFEEASFPYEPESFVGNHLMKTVALNVYLEEQDAKGFFEGIRWDEQGARQNEKYFSPRGDGRFVPDHVRICPILHFKERDVWDAIHKYSIPYCRIYKEGYRSLGARSTTRKTSDKPAWEQDLSQGTERNGRKQDKEKMMEKLRKFGYM